ncbi:MAG: acetyl-CoA carboxylase biotin carboxyl carrier protein [Saprospiraceae bacterium]|uniref:Biotin carboxyl carrier protein of acetyl-CoA carboxylase n=1 Tax=Candidatus Opimibacter skivensis TaxID=2982028 RepID=A0A9D7SQZ0_9BACT|nr:acetyl-CoA carboxylase biotin carboxyl carrier protein [Candidatus Opimibacter skivensis]
MDSKEIQELLKLINRLELAEFKYKQGEVAFSVKTKYYHHRSMDFGPAMGPLQVTSHTPQSTSSAQPSAPVKTNVESEGNGSGPAAVAPKDNLVEVRSPIVGTFYRSSSPDKPVYVKPGDAIEVGSVLCIIEAMKLFNEIESEVAGKIVKIVVEDASPVEYDQVLFLVDPNG